MDDRMLRETLNQLAEQEIPDDMNLIPDVLKQLHSTNRAARLHSFRVAAVVAALLIFSTVTVAAAVVLYQRSNDPGLKSAEEQGLFTELNMTETVNDVTMTLVRGYADANRVALFGTQRYDMAVVTMPEGGFDFRYQLTDRATGNELPIFFGGGGGGGGGSTVIEGQTELSFDSTSIEGEPEMLDLRLEIRIGAPQFSQQSMGGSGGGGGGGSSSQMPTPVPMPSRVPDDEFEPFTIAFDFSLPFIEEYVVPMSELEPVSANDIDMRVEYISITPSLTTIELCYTLPTESDLLWTPYMVLVTEEGEYTRELNLPLNTPVDAGEICQRQALSVPYVPGEDSQWTLEVRYLRSTFAATQANFDRALEMLTEAGLDVEVLAPPTGEQTFYLALGVAGPSDEEIDVNTVIAATLAQLSERIDGPWVFTFAAP